jgi:hypothetical protein
VRFPQIEVSVNELFRHRSFGGVVACSWASEWLNILTLNQLIEMTQQIIDDLRQLRIDIRKIVNEEFGQFVERNLKSDINQFEYNLNDLNDDLPDARCRKTGAAVAVAASETRQSTAFTITVQGNILERTFIRPQTECDGFDLVAEAAVF